MKATIDMVKQILVDTHNEYYNYDAIDLAEVKRRFNAGEDVTLEDFIKAWAFAYDFEKYFDINKDESVENVIDFFIDNNEFDYLDMLRNDEYEEFMDDIMHVID
ncbi:hypothetical protein [Eubacterium pyruvativorans]|uniref:hypothetical protein n=1 Tax=Eubacterium pyruvativorans TaxID=155865 RepID=UPI0023F306F0|nr:hypothetical protein [Eubacterium pyruvativorans]MDD7684489.1 hypothetical protein [Eubacterium pyruvativorans]